MHAELSFRVDYVATCERHREVHVHTGLSGIASKRLECSTREDDVPGVFLQEVESEARCQTQEIVTVY